MQVTKDAAMAIAKRMLNVDDADTARAAELLIILNASAGKDAEGKPRDYRPYIVIAYLLPLWSASERGMLKSADGAVWLTPADLMPFIESLLTMQESADCGLTIDPCWGVDALRVRLACGCGANKGELAAAAYGGGMAAMVI
jgi:hypothetical protein